METVTYKLNTAFVMSQDEITAYKALPNNMPNTKLSQKQKDLINSLYRKYISNTIDNQDWSMDLYKEEQKEKWPSGPRVTEYQAKQIVLNQVLELNEDRRLEMSPEQAANFFLSALNWRKCCQTIIKYAYRNTY